MHLKFNEDIKDYEVQNFWGDEQVKLVKFKTANDQYYYAYIPQSVELERIFDIHIQIAE